MQRAIWAIDNINFNLILDGEIENNSVKDKKFSPGGDIWTNEIPELGFEDEKVQEDYNNFLKDLIVLFSEPTINEVFINAKIGEESEYDNNIISNPIIIRKIEEYDVEEIIK